MSTSTTQPLSAAQVASQINAGTYATPGLINQLQGDPNYTGTTSSDYQGNIDPNNIMYNGQSLSSLGIGEGPNEVGQTLLGSGYANPGMTYDGKPISNAQQNAAYNQVASSQTHGIGGIALDLGLLAAAIYTGGAAMGAFGAADAAGGAAAVDAGSAMSTFGASADAGAAMGGVGADVGAGAMIDPMTGAAMSAGGNAATAGTMGGVSDMLGTGGSFATGAGTAGAAGGGLSMSQMGSLGSTASSAMGGGGSSGGGFQNQDVLNGMGANSGNVDTSGGGSGGMGSFLSSLSGTPGMGNMLQGLTGLAGANYLTNKNNQAAATANPFGPYRAQYANQLSNLMANPSSLQQTPGYQAGLQAVQRTDAAGGYLGSGNMMNDLFQYGGNMFNQQVNTLSNLAGANINPGTSAQIQQQGANNTMNMAGNSLGTLVNGMVMAGRS